MSRPFTWRPNLPTLVKVAETFWGEYREFFQPNGCVLAVRGMIDVLAALGELDVQPLGVTVLVLNRPATRHSYRHKCPVRHRGMPPHRTRRASDRAGRRSYEARG